MCVWGRFLFIVSDWGVDDVCVCVWIGGTVKREAKREASEGSRIWCD